MGLGQYNNLGEYFGPHTASSVFLILMLQLWFASGLKAILHYAVGLCFGHLKRSKTREKMQLTRVFTNA